MVDADWRPPQPEVAEGDDEVGQHQNPAYTAANLLEYRMKKRIRS
jgi:hypothetical protein